MRTASSPDVTPSALVHVFPGTAAQAVMARRWVRAAAGQLAGPDVAALAEGAVSELLANAVRHSRSGGPGGTVTVIIAGGADDVTVHVHDLGSAGAVPVPRPRRSEDLAESGRGLLIVQALSAAWGTCPAAACRCAAAAGPVADGRGCCVWFRLAVRGGAAGRRTAR